MGIVSDIGQSNLKQSGLKQSGGKRSAAENPQIDLERGHVIDKEVARLQRQWECVQAKIDDHASRTHTKPTLIQSLMSEGDRLLLMIRQLERARAETPAASK